MRLAAPSFLWPGTVAENCRWICERLPQVDEVGVCLFESAACLAYTGEDLPGWLADLGLRFHLHLPLDLPWAQGFEAGFSVIRGLLEMCAHLTPWAVVLHPPPEGYLARVAEGFAGLGWEPSRVLLENIRGEDLTGLWSEAVRLDFGVCLDVGHVLEYKQWPTLELPGIFGRTRMLHLHGAGEGFSHAGLGRLDAEGRGLTRRLLSATRGDAVRMVEVFQARAFRESLDFFEEDQTGRA
jgi:hypothetical protein